MKTMVTILLACLLAVSATRAAFAAGTMDLVRASLVSENRSVEAGVPFWVAVRLEMSEGWHVNWLNPGDAGLAPTVDWELPEGFEAGDLQWPHPEKFALPELSIYGYEGDVFLLTEITPPASVDAPVLIKARVTWLACSDACVPGEAKLELELDASERAAADPRWVSAFAKTRTALPAVAEGWRFSARLFDDRLSLTASPPGGEDVVLKHVALYPSAEGLIESAPPQRLSRNGGDFVLDVARSKIGLDAPPRLQGVLVSESGWGRIPRNAVAIDIPLE